MYRIPVVISVVALIVALGGNYAAYNIQQGSIKRNKDAIERIAKEGAVRREIIAKTDLMLCTKIYSEIVATERESINQANFNFYRKILPNLSDSAIRQLVNTAHHNADNVIRRFDPEQCKHLPSQKITS